MATALTPFVMVSNLMSPYVGGKVLFLKGIVFLVLSLVSGILLFSKVEEKEKMYLSIRKILRDPIFLALSLNIVLLLFSTIFAFDKTVAFFGDPGRCEGFLTIFSIFILFLSFRLFFEKKEWDRFFVLSSLVAVVLFIIELIQALNGANRPEALSGNADFLPVQYLFLIFAGLYTFQIGKSLNKRWYSILGVLATVLSVLGILLTKTRGVFVGLGVSVIICGIIAFFVQKEKVIFSKIPLKKIGIFLCSIFILFGLFFGITRNASFWHQVPGIDRVIETKIDDSSMRTRLLFIESSLTIFRSESNPARFLVGWGWDNYVFAWSKYYNPEVFYYGSEIADRAHNKIMELLVMTGILGLLSYLSVWFFACKKLYATLAPKDITIPFILAFFGISYFVSLLFIFDAPLTLFNFYIILAFISYLNYERKV